MSKSQGSTKGPPLLTLPVQPKFSDAAPPAPKVSEDLTETGGIMRGLLGNVHYRLRLTQLRTLSSNLGGNIADSFRLDLATMDNGNQPAKMFDEFRVVGGRMHFAPYDRYSKVSVSSRPLVVAFDNDNDLPNVLTTSDVWQYGTAKVHNIDDPFVYSFVRPHLTKAAYWTDVNDAAGSKGEILVNAEGLTINTNYGEVFMELDFEFRSSR